MLDWYASLNLLERVFAYLAIPSTVVLVIQTLLTVFGLFGADGADGDFTEVDAVDADLSDGGLEPDPGYDAAEVSGAFRLVTVRGMVAFLAVGGWTGLSVSRGGLGPIWSTLAALAAGFAAMALIAAVLYGLTRMNSSGTLDYRNALGATGEVYLTIPPDGCGKIQVVIQGSLRECSARQEGDRPLQTGCEVLVVAVDRDGTLVVKNANS